MGQGEVTEPGGPVVVQVPGDPKPVAGGPMSFGGLGHEDTTFAVAVMVRRLVVGRLMVRRLPCRRMTYSATARLMTQPAPRLRSKVSSLVPKTAFPMPRVNTWVPAPRARA